MFFRIIYILSSVIESYFNYDTYGGNLNDLKNSNLRIKKIDLNKHLASFASRGDRIPPNDDRHTQRNYVPIAPAPSRGSSSQTSAIERSPILQAVYSQRGSTSQASSSFQRNYTPIAQHYYGDDLPISMRKP